MLPNNVPSPHPMLRERQQLMEFLKVNLHQLVKWRFGPKSKVLDVDQFGLFADGSFVVELITSALKILRCCRITKRRLNPSGGSIV